MKLIACCGKCFKDIKVTPIKRDRAELEEVLGNTFYLRCEKCGEKSKTHIDEVKAEHSVTNYVKMLTFLILPTILMKILSSYGVISTVPFILCSGFMGAYYFDANSKIKEFNSFRVGKK